MHTSISQGYIWLQISIQKCKSIGETPIIKAAIKAECPANLVVNSLLNRLIITANAHFKRLIRRQI